MHHYYFQNSPTHKHFDLCGVKGVLALLDGPLASSITNLKLAWKTTTH